MADGMPAPNGAAKPSPGVVRTHHPFDAPPSHLIGCRKRSQTADATHPANQEYETAVEDRCLIRCSSCISACVKIREHGILQ